MFYRLSTPFVSEVCKANFDNAHCWNDKAGALKGSYYTGRIAMVAGKGSLEGKAWIEMEEMLKF